MIMPSARIQQEMYSSEAGVWFIPTTDGASVLIKAPVSSLKALSVSCSLEIGIGVFDEQVCVAGIIHDAPDKPLIVSRPQAHEEEHRALLEVLSRGEVNFFLFNEMDHCVGWSPGSLAPEGSEQASEYLQPITSLYTGSVIEFGESLLDIFNEALYENSTAEKIPELAAFKIPVKLVDWHPNFLSYVGMGTHQTVQVDHPDEGGMLENSVWAALSSVYPGRLYKSPVVENGDKTRELTDVLALSSHGNILIETKDLAMLASKGSRTHARRVSGVKKQALKGVAQLVGAAKALRRNCKISSREGKVLSADLSDKLHCVVIVSEFFHDNWDEVFEAAASAMRETGDLFHVIDFRELVAVLKIARGRDGWIQAVLLQRLEQVLVNQTLNVRSRQAPDSSA